MRKWRLKYLVAIIIYILPIIIGIVLINTHSVLAFVLIVCGICFSLIWSVIFLNYYNNDKRVKMNIDLSTREITFFKESAEKLYNFDQIESIEKISMNYFLFYIGFYVDLYYFKIGFEDDVEICVSCLEMEYFELDKMPTKSILVTLPIIIE